MGFSFVEDTGLYPYLKILLTIRLRSYESSKFSESIFVLNENTTRVIAVNCDSLRKQVDFILLRNDNN